MILYLFSDKKFEYQAEACLKSCEHKITDDIKVVYFTIGFSSTLKLKNLITVEIPINPLYPKFMYYKPELALKVLEMFPEENDFLFMDVDILFTSRIDFKKFTHQFDYPLSIYLAYEFPFKYHRIGNEVVYINEENLMKYFNVPKRSMRYQGSGFFAFNRHCIDFLKEWTSICKNEYLLEQEDKYFPFPDETAMNICLWKRNATESLGHIFVNTLSYDTIKLIEESEIKNKFLGNNIDDYGSDTEYVSDSSKILFYHGIKDKDELQKSLNYLLGKIDMKEQLIHEYETTSKTVKVPEPTIRHHNIDGMFVEILGGPKTQYNVKFINKKDNTVVYQTTIGNNCWAKATVHYYVDWRIEIQDLNSSYRYEYDFSLEGKKVLIALDSRSLGDTLAWIPYVEEFRKKHNCEVVCSTFLNHLFEHEYTDISFVNPSQEVLGIYAKYTLGIFYNENNTINFNMMPFYPLNRPLQQWASDILGLEYKEIRPKLTQPAVDDIDSNLITIAIHSTAQAKYWNNPTGWQGVVDWLNNKGYVVKLLSKESDGYMGNAYPTGITLCEDSSITGTMKELKRSKLFIGISSGLTWLSWAVGTPTVVVSGFSDSITEMQDCIRIDAPKNSCSGCFNRVKLNAGDWHWCPDHKNTERQYECSRNITSEMVIKELEKLL